MIQIGHRGAAGLAPENTLASIRRAIEAGVEMIELDVQVCATGELVLHHDVLVNRMTNGWGAIKNLSLAQLKELGIKEEKIPTLEEALKIIPTSVQVNVDMKGERVGDVLGKFACALPAKVRHNLVVSSRKANELFAFRKACPNIPTGFITQGVNPLQVRWASKNQFSFLSIPYGWLRRPFVRAAQRSRFEVFTFPYGPFRKMKQRRLEKLGVDGAIYNYPGKNPF